MEQRETFFLESVLVLDMLTDVSDVLNVGQDTSGQCAVHVDIGSTGAITLPEHPVAQDVDFKTTNVAKFTGVLREK